MIGVLFIILLIVLDIAAMFLIVYAAWKVVEKVRKFWQDKSRPPSQATSARPLD